jgi:ectoine hydroxylase-related dioxygenase (phytanoyl-CoA dioxygenase family)
MSTAVSKMRMGDHEMELGGKYLGLLRESNDIQHDAAALKARLASDGYLFIRGLQKRDKVQAARTSILQNLDSNGQIDRSFPLDQAVLAKGGRGAFMGGSKQVTRTPEFLNLVESPEIMGFFSHLFGKTSLTFDFKWLRAVGTGDFTGAHYDVVYMGRGTVRNLYTCWTPLGDIRFEDGPLAVLEGSHNLPSFQKLRDTYGRMDVDRDNVSGWFSNNPIEMVDKYGGQWKTTEFKMGDVLIFGMYTMHGSVKNETNRYRRARRRRSRWRRRARSGACKSILDFGFWILELGPV